MTDLYEDLDAILEHHGVKGMKWGVRREDPSGSGGSVAPVDHSVRNARIKKAAIGTGVLLAVSGAAYGAYVLNKNGKLPFKQAKPTAKAVEATKTVLKEPTDIIHSSRGHERGYTFLQRGGINAGDKDMVGIFGQGQGDGFFKRVGDAGKIAATFADPSGKKDQSGRTIMHDVIVPAHMSHGLNSSEDVKNKFFPALKPTFEAYYYTPANENFI